MMTKTQIKEMVDKRREKLTLDYITSSVKADIEAELFEYEQGIRDALSFIKLADKLK